MMRALLAFFLGTSLLLGSPGARAEHEAEAEALVRQVTNDVLATLREDEDLRGGDRQRAVSVIETKIAPHFDFPRMTTLAVGAAWRRADADQQQALVREFRTLLVRTYANALTAYSNQTVSFRPARPGAPGEVVVPSRINQPGGRPIALNYSLVRSGEEWKVFDVVVENISLVTNYRASFASEVERGGVDGLIRALREKNRSLGSKPPPVAGLGP